VCPRIAHVISTRGVGGAERFLVALLRYGDAHGWEQRVLNPFAADGSERLHALCEPTPVEWKRCDTPLEVLATRRWTKERLDGFRPDVTHVVLFHALVLVASLPKVPGDVRVATNVYGDYTNIAPHRWVIRSVDRWAGRRMDHVAAISESVRHFLVADYGYPAAKVTRIPLGWEGTPQPPKAAPRPPTIVCVGGLRPEKGHDVILAALSLVQRHVPDVRLVVVGDGEQRGALEADAHRRGLAAAVSFVGAAPDVWSYLADADVFVSASRSEAFGIAIAEAMAAGLPVVAPAVGAIPELVTPGVTGELVPPADPDALATQVVRILQSPELRARMSGAAREASSALRMERAVEDYFALFEQLRQQAQSAADRRAR
jgi:glycosyltransferase involved in cell wall biosynthesis